MSGYAYNEEAMMESIRAYKQEQAAERATARAARNLEIEEEIHKHVEAMRATLPAVPKKRESAARRVNAQRPQSWYHVPFRVVRRPIAHMSALPARARACLQVVCMQYGMTVEGLTRINRNHGIVIARHEAMYLLVRNGGYSLPKAALFMGGMHHTTVLYGVKKTRERMFADPAYKRIITAMEERVEGLLYSVEAE